MADLMREKREELAGKLYSREGEPFRQKAAQEVAAAAEKQKSRAENEGLLETMSPDQLERTHRLERDIARPKFHQDLQDVLERPDVKEAYLQHREESGEKPPAPFDSWEQEFAETYHRGRFLAPLLGIEGYEFPKAPPQPDVMKDVPSRD